ncbi:MAG: Asp-tRNA(Asn)/Glu-tRNA(Gln) amidotransferase subunit GatC [Acidimicrobiales bacterium]
MSARLTRRRDPRGPPGPTRADRRRDRPVHRTARRHPRTCADDIERLDVDDIEPTAHPLPLVNVLRPDATRSSLDRDEVLAQAPRAENGQFHVPPVLGEEP